MKQRIGPFLSARSFRTAMYSTMRFFTLSRPKWSSSRQRRQSAGSSLSLVVLLHGRSASHSRYVRVTLYSADCCCMPARRPSCFLAILFASSGSCARRMRSRSSSTSSSSVSPSSSRMLFICWRRISSRWFLPSSATMLEISRFTRSSSSCFVTIERTRRTRSFTSNVARTFCLSPTVTWSIVRFDAMRSASAPLSRTFSRMPLVSFGRFGIRFRSSRVPSRSCEPSEIELAVALEILGDAPDLRSHVRLEAHLAGELEPRQAVQHDRVVGGPEADHLHDAGDCADVVRYPRSRARRRRRRAGSRCRRRRDPDRGDPRPSVRSVRGRH